MYVCIYDETILHLGVEIMEAVPDHYVQARKVRWARFLRDQTQSRLETWCREICGMCGHFRALDTHDAYGWNFLLHRAHMI
jgi:hypothetical protein